MFGCSVLSAKGASEGVRGIPPGNATVDGNPNNEAAVVAAADEGKGGGHPARGPDGHRHKGSIRRKGAGGRRPLVSHILDVAKS